jgi:hypothetical protein
MCPPFDDPPGFGEDRAEKLVNQAGGAMENFVVADADLEDVSGDVVALVVFEADDIDETQDVLEREFEDVVASTGPVRSQPHLDAVSCRGPASRVRELVAHLEADTAVSGVTATLLRAPDGQN